MNTKDFEKEMEKWDSGSDKKNKELGIKDNYNGGMDSKYYFSASRVGATTSPQVANQIGELNSRLNQGLKAVELGTLNQRLLDQVPKEHFTEIRRMSKLTGAEPSLHAPIQDLDLAGFTQQGWDEHEQERKIKQLGSVIERAYMMDPKGNVPITIHAGTFPAQKWQKEGLKEETEEGIKKAEDKRSEMMLINPHTGQVQPVRYRERKRIGRDEPDIWTPEKYMHNMNAVQWDEEKFRLLQWKKMMDEKEDRTNQILSRSDYLGMENDEKTGILPTEKRRELERMRNEIRDTETFKEEAYRNMRSALEDMYERFEKYPYTKGEEAGDYELYKKDRYPKFQKEFKKGEEEREEKLKELRDTRTKLLESINKKNEKDANIYREKFERSRAEMNNVYNRQTEMIVREFEHMPAPRVWQPVDEFAQEKTSTSLAEAAFDAYGKYGKNTPMLLLENVYPEFALSRADSLKATIEEARDKFTQKLVKEKKMGKKEAEDAAKKVMGVTWDVGHIFMLKKSGYTDEDIKKEAEKIAPFVKHLHLTDNFGFEDSHLPPGLGEVNIKEQLKAMEKIHAKLGTKEDFEKVRGIVEAGEFVANYKEVPHLYALSHLGSPLYSEDAAPYWHQIWDTYGSYSGGHGELLPQKYFDLYGSPGFSQLPAALGGAGTTGPERGRFASSAATESEET